MESNDIPERIQWKSRWEFLMLCIALCIGLGNIWRFPFVVYENGGGAFLVAYLIVLVCIGRPLYYTEVAMGQFCQWGNVKTYESLAPAFKGIGFAQMVPLFAVLTYGSSLAAISLLYVFNSFTSTLPWSYCKEDWNSHLEQLNKSCVGSDFVASSIYNSNSISSSELFFLWDVLKEVDNLDNGIGYPNWQLSLCLLLSWIIIFVVMSQGIKSSGKASYFLALFPYAIMLILLIRAVTLTGALEGLSYFVRTDWNKLLSPDVWFAAVTQCLFSLTIGFGNLIMYGSYNNFKHDINWDTTIIGVLDTLTSLTSGVTTFCILGNLAHEMGVKTEDVITSGGTSLAFIVYPNAISKFTITPWLFALLFFVMLYTLIIGSGIAGLNTIVTVVKDAFPNVATWKVSLSISVLGCCAGQMYVTPGGQFLLNLVDHFSGTFTIFVTVMAEAIVVFWFYGISQFSLDIEFMVGKRVNLFRKFCLGVVAPVLLILIFIYFLINSQRLTYGSKPYPDIVLGLGWFVFGIAVLQIPFWFIVYLITHRKSSQVWHDAFSHDNWGPKNPNLRKEWKNFKDLHKSDGSKCLWVRKKNYTVSNS